MDYSKLLASFLNLVSENKRARFEMENKLPIACKQFELVISASDLTQINWLKDRYMSELTQIKYTISRMPELRSLHDKIFTKHLKYNKNIPTYITYAFENFIKGITYFKDEFEQITPIYHRFYSCGPYERCYIERLIYNELYIHESLHFPERGYDDNKQDEGHFFRMDLTMKDFQSCFPNTTIKVKIEYEDNFPYRLEIIRTNNGKITKLSFNKNFIINIHGGKEYNDLVECIKDEDGKKYIKTSLFDIQSKFHLYQPKM